MKLEKQDWKKLQPTLIVLGLVVIVLLVALALAQNYSSQQATALQKQQNQLKSTQQRYQSVGLEKDTITEYLPQYQALISKGLVGEERRLAWVDALRLQHQNLKLFNIQYNIGLQEAYTPSFAASVGSFSLQRSIMKLELDMLHEEDILNLTENLSAKNNEVFMLRDCEIRKLGTSAEMSSQLVANLHAKCELDWLTLREPAPINAAVP